MTARLRIYLLLLLVAAGAAVWRWTMTPRPGPGYRFSRAAAEAQEQGRLDEATDRLRQAVLMEPQNGGYHAELGELYLHQGRSREAAVELQAAAFLDPKRPHVFCYLAEALVDERDRDAASAALKEALQRTPDCPHALSVQGELLLRDDNLRDALPYFQKAIRLQPDGALAYQKAGYILLETNRTDEAQATLLRGLSADPAQPGTHFLLAKTYMRHPGDPKSLALAEQHFRLALRNNPEAAKAHAALGQIYGRKHALRQARAEYLQALALDPGLGDALYGMAQAAGQEGESQQAAAYLKRFEDGRNVGREVTDLIAQTTAQPQNPALGCRLVRLCLEHGFLKEARRAIDAAVQQDPSRRETRELRAQVYAAAGQPDRAARELAIAAGLPRAGGS